MNSISASGASAPPDLSTLQRARVVGRVSVSAAVADVLARHAFGADRRDHDVLLVGLVDDRVGAAAGAR